MVKLKQGKMNFVRSRAVTALLLILMIILAAPIFMHRNRMEEVEWYFRTSTIEGKLSDPKVKMVYAEIVSPFTLEIGIYPELTPEIEEEIRALGEPYNASWIKYVGTARPVYPSKENDMGITIPTFF